MKGMGKPKGGLKQPQGLKKASPPKNVNFNQSMKGGPRSGAKQKGFSK